jgi:carboxymethylenebutenolidase
MRAFVAHPDTGGPFPVGVIYMDAPGYREALKDIARRYASSGYYVVLPDMYHRFGEVRIDIDKILEEGREGPEMKRLMDYVGRLTPELGEADTRAVLAYVATDAHARPGAKVCLGYCMGARHVLRTMSANPDEFVAGCGIHPGPLATDQPDSPHRELAAVKGELYLGFAEQDEASAPDVLAALDDEARRHGVMLQMEVFPGTLHGFAVAGSPVYQEEGSERHFERTLDVWGRSQREAVGAR